MCPSLALDTVAISGFASVEVSQGAVLSAPFVSVQVCPPLALLSRPDKYMHIHVCGYVCIYIYMIIDYMYIIYIYIYICMYECIYIYEYVYIYRSRYRSFWFIQVCPPLALISRFGVWGFGQHVSNLG